MSYIAMFGFLFWVASLVRPAIDFVWERLKRIKRAKRREEDLIGWIFLIWLCVLLFAASLSSI